jgi:1-acyl-sn-glycerol-3-phosphate acyltransferase
VNDKRTLSKTLADTILRVLGWRVQVTWPGTDKFVLIGAPHTSNWDFIYMLLFKFAIGINPYWVAKDSMFRWPWGGLWNKIGGIPVNRRSRNNFVDQMVEAFRQRDAMILVIAPEGTRSKVGYWKSGFYYIALGAGVPIALGFLDFGRKVGGLGPAIMPTGDIQTDFALIRNFYAGMKGKHPQRQGEIMLRPD